jgi:chorismate mutase
LEDKGTPIRKATYQLLETMLEKFHHCSPDIVDSVISGTSDSAEEVMVLCLVFLGKIITANPQIVTSFLDKIVDSFQATFQKNVKNLAASNNSQKSQNIMRAVLRVVEQLHR